ncbi:MAG TPA: chemotaxis protein CheW [Polyangia bacterium]|jgi:purine-binding chemotaxis protein CheW
MASQLSHVPTVGVSDRPSKSNLAIVCRVRDRHCALFASQVIETLRPLPTAPLAAMPPFVKGLAVIRGTPTPVVDAGALLGDTAEARPTRFVVIRLGERQVALAVEAVLGVRALSSALLTDLPPLLRHASEDTVSKLGTLDAELLVVLDGAYLVPSSLWDQLGLASAPA